MLLAVDIGNTNIRFGIFKGDRRVSSYSLSAGGKSYSAFLSRVVRRHGIERVVVCSVVPKALRGLIRELKRILGSGNLYIIGRDIKVPVRNLYRLPKQVGQDRLVNAFAGVRLYGSPLIVVDSGTAITLDVVTKKKEYLGGVILPGLDLSLDALYEQTALLPKLSLAPPREIIGRDTKNSILSGIVYGFAAAIDELVVKIKKEIGADAQVIGTGGDIQMLKRYSKGIRKIDADLTLKGINLLGKFFG